MDKWLWYTSFAITWHFHDISNTMPKTFKNRGRPFADLIIDVILMFLPVLLANPHASLSAERLNIHCPPTTIRILQIPRQLQLNPTYRQRHHR